ncbi:methylated-DNA--[protein]-cysteine S-methyltransferase [Arthrobacter sp. MSA 4-2]|uniref:methylated-DNA--[protein]-cysteine S-methyltransferase n=1 Tax=Arthrobacter sp. MSA 4-2 TaxID=2794349 RepID=UPI0018E85CF2|nr:methylated-DNA--[protein]-cysteine S-methyltransferase [Arthrobacter sp. MSA 4-2]MBJ2120002.1 methylated-DNA--[protein]-cysteine S-methyltransferase [Arthrobacter sp. MSA 4-2]
MRQHYRIESPIGGLILVAAQGGLVGAYHERHDPQPGVVLLGEPWQEHRPGHRDAGHPKAGAPPGSEPSVTAGTVVNGIVPREHGGSTGRDAGGVLIDAARQLEEYFAGTRRSFQLLLLPAGTGFQHRVWAAVARIPYGQTRTYRSIAAALGNPAMGRAVGAAVRANPLSILIPGHRVVAGNGALAGYAAGIDAKRFLLDLEGAAVSEEVNTARSAAGESGRTGITAGPVIATDTAGVSAEGSSALRAISGAGSPRGGTGRGRSRGQQRDLVSGAPVGRGHQEGAE